MKKIEKESFFKSFFLFFISQAILVSLLFYLEYQKEQKQYDEQLFTKMRLCSLDLRCKSLEVDFVKKDHKKVFEFYKNSFEVGSYFLINDKSQYLLKIYLPYQKYLQNIRIIQEKLLIEYVVVLFVVIVLSILFSLYTLSPYKKALALTEEFIKDILHDFNTPLSTLRLNVSLLQKDCPNSKKIKRIQNSVATILHLQENLRSYLFYHQTAQKEIVDLYGLLKERVLLVQSTYPHIKFQIQQCEYKIFVHKDAFIRIIDNLLSNSCKYNKQNGSVLLYCKEKKLYIEDTGVGIVNPKKIFERYYKEHQRGLGIGLHIVKKLCEELNIDIEVQSQLDKGSVFILNLHQLLKSEPIGSQIL